MRMALVRKPVPTFREPCGRQKKGAPQRASSTPAAGPGPARRGV
jgi:hypothetical protein